MKIWRRLSLRLRITLLAGVILVLCSVVLTITATYNANNQFVQLTKAAPAQYTTAGNPNFPQTTAPAGPTATLALAKRQFNAASNIFLAVVSVLGTGLVYVVAGSSLRPIRKLSDTVSAITSDSLQQRVLDENRHDEVGALGRSFNVMLDRLEKSFLRQKRFSASVAHELKTPLATINAGIQVLRLDESPTLDDYEKLLTTTERNISRLIAVVDDLMELCVENEKLSETEIDLTEMFESIVSELRPILDEKNLETEIACQARFVCGNAELIYRVFFNLIENAAKYNRSGGKIRAESHTESGVTLIVISDTGSGIPEDELQNIFEPFYRVNKSRSRKTGGAGLGLSIVKTIVEKHGWGIGAASVPGQGAMFTVTAPETIRSSSSS